MILSLLLGEGGAPIGETDEGCLTVSPSLTACPAEYNLRDEGILSLLLGEGGAPSGGMDEGCLTVSPRLTAEDQFFPEQSDQSRYTHRENWSRFRY